MKYDVTEAARKVRKILKANYPGHKFSVRVSRFAGGSSADISWADGPTQQQVEKLTDHLKGWDNGYRNEYIGISRKYTLEMMKAAAATAAVFYGIPVPHIDTNHSPYCTDYTTVMAGGRKEAVCDLVHRACHNTSVYRVYLETAFLGAFTN